MAAILSTPSDENINYYKTEILPEMSASEVVDCFGTLMRDKYSSNHWKVQTLRQWIIEHLEKRDGQEKVAAL